MIDEIKDIFLMGVGAASLTRKKVQKKIDELANKGIISQSEAREIIERIMSEVALVRNKLRAEGSREIKKAKKRIMSAGKRTGKKVSKGLSRISRAIASEAINKK